MAIEYEQKIGMTAEKHFRRNALRAILALFDRDGCSVYVAFMVAIFEPLRYSSRSIMDSAEDNSVPSLSPSTAEATSSFPKTRWTTVLVAREENLEKAAVAMQELCRLYWYPIYAFIRRNSNPQDAED